MKRAFSLFLSLALLLCLFPAIPAEAAQESGQIPSIEEQVLAYVKSLGF